MVYNSYQMADKVLLYNVWNNWPAVMIELKKTVSKWNYWEYCYALRLQFCTDTSGDNPKWRWRNPSPMTKWKLCKSSRFWVVKKRSSQQKVRGGSFALDVTVGDLRPIKHRVQRNSSLENFQSKPNKKDGGFIV
jgi:hypothetical protein